MSFQDFAETIAILKRKLLIIGIIFAVASMISFPFMDDLINKIKYDMYGENDSELFKLSKNLDSISAELTGIAADNNSTSARLAGISQNLTMVSNNISKTIQKYGYQNNPAFVTISPMESLMLEFKMSLVFGFISILPFIAYYSYRGLNKRLKGRINISKRYLFGILFSMILLFLVGTGYAYFIMLPFFMKYLYADTINIAVPNYSIYNFIYFIVMMTLIFGLSFELPVVLTTLMHFGVASYETLSNYRKHAYVILLIIAAWISPGPDIFSQLMIMGPFVLLFEVSLIIGRLMGKTKKNAGGTDRR